MIDLKKEYSDVIEWRSEIHHTYMYLWLATYQVCLLLLQNPKGSVSKDDTW